MESAGGKSIRPVGTRLEFASVSTPEKSKKPKILHLHLKSEYFHQIALGTKTYEYRKCSKYWHPRICNRSYDLICLHNGYPKRGDKSATLIRKWDHFTIATITHEQFGPKPVQVYAIDVTHQLPGTELSRA